MPISPEQQTILDHIWKTLHESQGNSQAAAQKTREQRLLEEDPTSEMALELAAMEFLTASAAAWRSNSFEKAYSLLVQAVEVIIATFPFAADEELAKLKGKNWDKVYGNLNAQMEMLRNYYNFIRRLVLIIPKEKFVAYSQSLLQTFLSLSEKLNDEATVQIFKIEHSEYPQALEAFEAFVHSIKAKEKTSKPDSSRIISAAALMRKRALIENDYVTARKTILVAANALRKNPKKLEHFARQIGATFLTERDKAEKEKLQSWQSDAKQYDLSVFEQLLAITYIGLGNDKVVPLLK